MRIRAKFLIVFFITSFLPLVFLAYVSFNTSRQALIKDTQEKLEIIAELDITRLREVAADPSLVAAVIANYRGLGSTGEVIVAKRGQDGSIVYLAPRRFENSAKVESYLMARALNRQEGFFPDEIGYEGKPVVAVTRYIPQLEWGVLVKVDRAEAFQSVDALRDIMIIFSFIFILLIVMVALFFMHSITAPILSLVSVAKQVERGDLSKRALVQSKDEIGELTSTFNGMVASLEELHGYLEKKVAERTEQLAASNNDLEAFTYSVSHDLRAPLRSVDGFSKILQEDYAAKFDDEGKHVIETIRTSTKRMGNLIDDLLTFSRLGRQTIKTSDVDMTAMAKTVFDELKLANPERQIQFTCEVLPVAHADQSLIRQVWVNLLSNAIKFTRKKNIAVITVGSRQDNGNDIYYVKDNGAGFDMKYIDKLFMVFQRLHTVQEFEGTGIGLSIVKRIIEKHGGKVWAEAAVDQGATFYFFLAKPNIANS